MPAFSHTPRDILFQSEELPGQTWTHSFFTTTLSHWTHPFLATSCENLQLLLLAWCCSFTLHIHRAAWAFLSFLQHLRCCCRYGFLRSRSLSVHGTTSSTPTWGSPPSKYWWTDQCAHSRSIPLYIAVEDPQKVQLGIWSSHSQLCFIRASRFHRTASVIGVRRFEKESDDLVRRFDQHSHCMNEYRLALETQRSSIHVVDHEGLSLATFWTVGSLHQRRVKKCQDRFRVGTVVISQWRRIFKKCSRRRCGWSKRWLSVVFLMIPVASGIHVWSLFSRIRYLQIRETRFVRTVLFLCAVDVLGTLSLSVHVSPCSAFHWCTATCFVNQLPSLIVAEFFQFTLVDTIFKSDDCVIPSPPKKKKRRFNIGASLDPHPTFVRKTLTCQLKCRGRFSFHFSSNQCVNSVLNVSPHLVTRDALCTAQTENVAVGFPGG